MKRYLFIFILIMFISLVSSATDTVTVTDTYKVGELIQYKKACINAGTYCSSSAICNFTIISPSGNVLINNVKGTNNIAYHNITVTPNETGVYVVDMVCFDGEDKGYNTLYFETTASGLSSPNESGGLIILGSLIVLIIISFFFIVIGYKQENLYGKIIFFGISGIFLIITILYTLVSMTQILGGFSVLIDGYSTFWFVIKIIVGIAILSLLVFALLITWNLWQFKRGFRD